MVIDRRRQIGLYFGSVFADRKFWPVLDVTLYEHHPMWFAEAFGGTVEGFSVSPEVLPAESGFIQVAFQGRSCQYSGSHMAFQFQDHDDLGNGSFWYFPPELYGLFQKMIKVFREALRAVLHPGPGF